MGDRSVDAGVDAVAVPLVLSASANPEDEHVFMESLPLTSPIVESGEGTHSLHGMLALVEPDPADPSSIRNALHPPAISHHVPSAVDHSPLSNISDPFEHALPNDDPSPAKTIVEFLFNSATDSHITVDGDSQFSLSDIDEASMPLHSSVSDDFCADVDHREHRPTNEPTSIPSDYQQRMLSLCTQLDNAHTKINILQSTRDAMSTSIESLKVLAENERTVTRITKRQLAEARTELRSALHTTAEEKKRQTATLQSRVNELETQLAEASRNAEEYSLKLRTLQSQLEMKDAECQKLCDSNIGLSTDQHTAVLQVRNLSTQLEQRDEANAKLTSMVREKTLAVDKTNADVSALHVKVEALDSISKERDALSKQVIHLEKVNQKHVDSENSLRSALQEKEETIDKLTAMLRQESMKVANLEKSNEDTNALQARVMELEGESKMDITAEDEVDQSQVEGLSQELVLKKLQELKVCRLVLESRTNDIEEMRTILADAVKREMVITASRNAAAQSLISLSRQFDETEADLSNARSMAFISEKARREMEVKLGPFKLGGMESKEDLANQDSQDPEQRATQLRLPEAQRAHVVDDPKRLRILLSDAHQGDAGPRSKMANSSAAVDDIGATSPCSIDSSANGGISLPRTSYTYSESLADMEAASNSPPHGVQMKPETDLPRHVPDDDNMECDEPAELNHEVLAYTGLDSENDASKARAQAAALREALQSVDREMEIKVRECKAMESHIEDRLEPELEATISNLKKRTVELENVRREYALFKESSEKTRVGLENDVFSKSQTLNDSVKEIKDLKHRLNHCENVINAQEIQVTRLSQEKERNCELVKTLQSTCEYRHQSLVALRQRLQEVESTVADCEQKRYDAQVEKDRLEGIIRDEKDQRHVAEQRAARKDSLLYSLEAQNRELAKDHSSVKRALLGTSERLRLTEQQVADLEEALKENKEALQNHAKKAFHRSEADTQTISELRGKMKSHEDNLHAAHANLSSVDKRAKSLSEALASSSARLRVSERNLQELKRREAAIDSKLQHRDKCILDLEKSLSVSKTSYDTAKDELSKKSAQISSLRTMLSEKGRAIVEVLNEKMELEKRVSELKGEINVESNKRDALGSRMVILRSDVDRLRKELSSTEEELRERTSEAESLSINLSVTQEKLNSAEQLASEMETKIMKDQKSTAHLQSELQNTRQELQMVKSHVDGHDTLVQDHKMKEKMLSLKVAELSRTTSYIAHADNRIRELENMLASKEKCTEKLGYDISVLQRVRDDLEESLISVRGAHDTAEATWRVEAENLKKTIQSLESEVQELELEKTSLNEQMRGARSEIVELNEQLAESQAHGESLVASLTMTELELAQRKESTVSMEDKVRMMVRSLEERENDVEDLQKQLAESKSCSVGCEGDVLSEETRLATTLKENMPSAEPKEKDITKLRDWCSFINSKLRQAENDVLEREADLEVCSEAFSKLDTRMNHLNTLVLEKEAEIRKMKHAHGLEVAKLESRAQVLRAGIDSGSEDVTDNLFNLDRVHDLSLSSMYECLWHRRTQSSHRSTLRVPTDDLSHPKRCF